MSLLMDALRRAETAKQESARQTQGGLLPTASDMLSLEPISPEPGKGSTNPLPDLAAHIAAVDADLASNAPPEQRPPLAPARSAPQPKANETREAVRNAFAAKQQPSDTPSRLPLWLALGTLTIAGVAIGGYVWYQLNAMNQGALAPKMPTPSANVAPPPASVAMAPAAPVVQNSDFGPFSRSTVRSPPEEAETPLFSRRESRNDYAAPPSETSANPPIRLTRTRPEPDANLARGHASLQRGETEASRREFEQALQRDPNNTDALLALAAIAQRQGRVADADAMRERAMVANPSDAAVQAAALGSSAGSVDPHTTESRLKSLLSSQPESAPLNFALGNLYARQGRWAEAQQVYFNAVAAEGDNPDYLFNLAVSLDHIRQSRLAAQHYRLALEASARRPAGFARDKVEKRLSELQGERQP